MEPNNELIMISQRDWKRLVRYVMGELEPEDADLVRAWAASSPRRAAALKAVVELWRETEGRDADIAGWDVNRAWAEFQPRLAGPEATPERQVIHLVPRVPLARKIGRAAATVAVLAATVAAALVGFQAFKVLNQDGRNLVVFEALPGQRKIVRLSDGTRVMLASDSRLIVPNRFREDRRSVELVGEAWFEVARSEARPFTVHAGYVDTRVLGTSFDVRAYPGSSSVDVVVAEGSVRVARRGAQVAGNVVLQAGQKAAVPFQGETRVAKADLARDLAWTEGRLVFDGNRLDDVLDELGRWYGIEFSLNARDLAGRSFTATFAGETLQEAVDVIAAALDLRYVVRGDTVVFEPKSQSR